MAEMMTITGYVVQGIEFTVDFSECIYDNVYKYLDLKCCWAVSNLVHFNKFDTITLQDKN